MKKHNFMFGHPIVFLINDYLNISRHNYVYVSFLAAIYFVCKKSSSGVKMFVYKT